MMKKTALLAVLLPALILTGAHGFEELLFEEFDVVFSATRMEQPIEESPAAITVITEEQIRQSGARNIPEVLRQVVGLSVIRVTAGEYQVSSRGFDKIPGNKMAYLVNGVPMVTYGAYDAPVWGLLHISVEDIERIEVIRGPGSSLYGSNAMLGVINIMTKDPADTPGGFVSVTAGEYETMDGSIRYGRAEDKYAYRLGANYSTREEFGPMPGTDDIEIGSVSGLLQFDYYPSDDSELSFFGGYVQGDGAVAYETTGYMNTNDFQKLDLSLGYTFPSTELKVYMKRLDIDEVVLQGQPVPFDEMYMQAEARRTETVGKHTIIGGLEYSNNTVETGLFDKTVGESAEESLDSVSAYLQDDFRVLDQLLLNASLRYDYNKLAEGHLTNRASAIYFPSDNHSLRATYGTSYRNPNFIEYFYEAEQEVDMGGGLSYTQSVDGNENNDPELAESYELGYRGVFSEDLELNANLFFMKVKDFTALDVVDMDLIPHPLDPTTFIPSHVYIEHTNTGEAEEVGGELELSYQLTDWMGSFANYTYLNAYETEPDIAERLRCTAQHRGNAGMNFLFDNGISASLLLHYADETEWPTQGASEWGAGGTADAYTLVNARLGYTLPVGDNSLRFSVYAFNLLDEEQSQYPVESAPLTRKVTATASMMF